MTLKQVFSGFLGRNFNVNVDNLPSQQQYPATAGLINNQIATYADPSIESFLRDGFAGNASVYTIVSKAAKKFGHINRGVYKIENKKAFDKYKNLSKAGLNNTAAFLNAMRHRNKAYAGEAAISGKLSDLIARPNDNQGQDSFFELAYVSYLIAGEAFIWLNRGLSSDEIGQMDDIDIRKVPVIEMYIMPADKIEIISSQGNPWGVDGYWFNNQQIGTTSRSFIPKSCMIHWKKTNPVFDPSSMRRHLRGLSPMKAGNQIITQDADNTNATVAMYQNGGGKGVIFDKSLKTITPEQRTQLTNVIDTKINGNGNKGKIASVQGDWGYLDLGMTAVDMQLIQGGQEVFTRMCNLFDVPPALFLTDQTYENKAASIKDWLLNSIIPAAASLRDEMNRVLLIGFGLSGVIIDNDISDIPELQEDLGKLVTWMAQMPWLTPNEKREYLGEDPSAEDGADEIWIPNNLVKMQDAGMPDVVPPLDAQSVNDYNQAVTGGEVKPIKKPVQQ
ncbi:MAG: phage portal protein [Taibaiella sp.]|nr:phage portal protein [Taibaiella sp.]